MRPCLKLDKTFENSSVLLENASRDSGPIFHETSRKHVNVFNNVIVQTFHTYFSRRSLPVDACQSPPGQTDVCGQSQSSPSHEVSRR